MSLPYEVHVVESMTNRKILPDTFPVQGAPGGEIRVTACPGEYEPASFVVYARDNLKGLSVTATDLRNGPSSIPSAAIDIRVVKCWFQAGVALSETNKRILTPELLLKDDTLVTVDESGRNNYLRVRNGAGEEQRVLISGRDSDALRAVTPRDAAVLQPVDIDRGKVKQFWVTILVPDGAAPGWYEGRIKLSGPKVPMAELPLRVRVLPFTLAKPVLTYAIYYLAQLTNAAPDVRAKASNDNKNVITAKFKTPQQYSAEMKNLKAHGIDYPTMEHYDHKAKSFDAQCTRQMLEIRQRAGLPRDVVYSMGIRTFNPTDTVAIEALYKRVSDYIDLMREYGYSEVYVYGIDEARGYLLRSQRPAWTAAHRAGAKVFVACTKGAYEAMGDILDVAVHYGPLDPFEAQKYHRSGNRIFSYSNPQIGMEEPETYRRNYGLALWKAGYDGAMDYAYQEEFGHIWNDFDANPRANYRDHVFAYPTEDGVIDTIQWEGFREGYDDVRYLSTLLKTISEARAGKPARASEAQAWVDRLDPGRNLNDLRAEIIAWIEKLR